MMEYLIGSIKSLTFQKCFSTGNSTITIDTLVPSVNLENPINNSGNSDGNLIFYYNVSDSSQ